MWIRTKDGWYIFELRGVCYVSWVSANDKANASIFPANKIDQWVDLIQDMTGKEVEGVEPFV